MLTFGSSELWPSLANIGIALVVTAAIIAVVVWRGKKRGSRTIALDAALTVSGWWVIMAVVGALFIVIKAFSVSWAELDGTTNVWVDWPAALPCSEFGDSDDTILTCGGEALTRFTVGNASLGLRLLAAAAQLSTLALSTMPAVILMMICFQTLRGRTFSRTVTRALNGGAIAVLLIGVAADLLQGIAATTALREVFPSDSEWFPSAYQLTVTPLPFVGALALAALAAVFREGSRLQQEREHLQRETTRLQKDTEGLV
ncbi:MULTISPECIES: hypothetical protein [unclassified Microbacterium]|uniref:hypothetical protein n=1 Tax=unclassified Microbacterium TaxID=2609290 RepID=UPI000EA9FE9D|nr:MULTISPECIES: hypothetical protein [unclassified Microbacterium]MBT2483578.1 hypothetical protein [Microbacterium sp. ISL-108]RKN66589.1 hypothetical protein D7252_02595 [Microbacterium sp. CGR2]